MPGARRRILSVINNGARLLQTRWRSPSRAYCSWGLVLIHIQRPSAKRSRSWNKRRLHRLTRTNFGAIVNFNGGPAAL